MSIIALLTFIGFRLTTKSSFHELQEARLVCAFIATQATRAIAHQKEMAIVINPTANTFNANGRLLKLEYLSCGSAPFAYGPPSQPSNPIVNPTTFENNTILCKPDGTINHGSLYLVNADQSIVYAVTIPVLSTASIRLYSCSAALNWQLRSIEW